VDLVYGRTLQDVFVVHFWKISSSALIIFTIMLGLTLLAGLLQVSATSAVRTLSIDTTSGKVQGAIDDSTPNVAHFLGIPFAEQPVGPRRWLPPAPKKKEKKTIDATKFGPSCTQYEADEIKFPSVWLTDAPEFVITPRDFQSEECLSVNVWTPFTEKETKPLPVIAWIHGGSFRTGGATVPYQDPSPWVQRSGKHIVVGIK
jgi:acetylcholinesterase